MDPRSDEELDDLLTSASPVSVAQSPTLEAILDDLVAETMRGARPAAGRRRRRRVGLIAAALVTAAGAGLGATAVAGALIPSPKTTNWFDEDGIVAIPMTFSSGQSCDVTFAPVPMETATDAEDEWDRAMSAAHTFMKSVDPVSISVPDAIAALRAKAPNADLVEPGA